MIIQLLPQTYFFNSFRHGRPCACVHTGLVSPSWADCLSASPFFVFTPWHVRFQPRGPWPPSSTPCWNVFLFEGQWWCKRVSTHGAPVSLHTLLMALANGCLPWLPFHVPKFDAPRSWHISPHMFSPYFHTRLGHKFSIVVPLRQQPHCLQARVLRARHMLLTVTFYSAEDWTTCSPVLLGAIHLHGTGIPCFLRWTFLSLQPSLSWGGPFSTQVSNDTPCFQKVLQV